MCMKSNVVSGFWAKVAEKRKQRGFSLAEAGLVLALGMAAFATAYGFYRSGSNDITTQAQVTGTLSLANNIERAYHSAGNYTGMTTASVAGSGLVPSAFRVSGTTITHGWGGALAVDAATDVSTYEMKFSAMPKNTCAEFVASVESIASIIVVGSTTVKDMTAVTPEPLSMTDLLTACGTLAGDITFTNS